ncbi:DNA or RNA helicase of superfamily II [Pseudomonas sp. WN033]|nr:DNA or RNA helicase of superfamily II [Pseudomonas sp. WN033]
MQPIARHTCPLCGQPNGCAPAAAGSFEVDCWCRQVSVSPQALAQVPEALKGKACLCRACAVADASAEQGNEPAD